MNRFILLLLLLSLTLCGCIAYNSTSVLQKTLSLANCPNTKATTPPPHVDPALPGFGGDMVYGSGHVIDGKANVYLIFWIDGTFQPASPLFVHLTEQFIQDAGQSPFYANLAQYHDAQNNRPACDVLAGTFIDTRPFPADLVAAWQKGAGRVQSTTPDSLSDTTWRNEIASVAQQQGWNTQDYHNIFVMLPTMRWGACGYHNFLKNGNQVGSPWAFISYPYDKGTGREDCADAPLSPNNDPTADITVDTLSHELAEAVSDPFLRAWTSNGFEVADKCQLITPAIINPRTRGDMTWQGHTYIIQEEYDNVRHGCVLGGP